MQTAKSDASGKHCSLSDDDGDRFPQSARMKDGPDPTAVNLKAWRERYKLTQAQLGERVGTTGSVISLLEAGERGLSSKWIRKLADALGLKPGFLMDYNPETADTSTIELIEAVSALDRPTRETAVRIVRSLRTGTDG